MTAGERSGRGYGHDDEYASPTYPAYPAYPAPSGDDPAGYQPGPNGYNGAGYPDPHRAPGYPSSGYSGSDYPSAAGSNGYPAAGNGYPGYPAAGRGYPPAGSNGYPPAGSTGYPAGGHGYPSAGSNGYPPAGSNGYPPAGSNGYSAGRHSAGAGRHYRPDHPDSGHRDAGYGHDAYAGPQPRGGTYRGNGYPDPAYRVAEPATTGVRPAAYPAQTYPPPPRALPAGAWSRAEGHDVARHRQVGSPSAGGPGRRGGGRGAAATGVAEAEPEQQGKRRRLPLWQELPLLLVIAFCLAVLIRTFLLQAFFIPSGSMEDTLITGDRVLVNKVIYNFREPTRGEVVVFKGTDAWAPLATDDGEIGTFAKVARTFGDLVGVSQPGEKDYIKRVVGLPGDVVSCCDEEGRVLVNGSPVDEPYVVRDSPLAEATPEVSDCRSRQFAEVVVEPGYMFVMGDHRARSQDSRCQGQVPIENVIGRAFIIVWPNDRWAGLSATDAFNNVPAPATAAAGPARDLDAVEEVPAPPAGQLGIVLPLLLPLVSTSVLGGRGGGVIRAGRPARSRVPRRGAGRRLSA